MTFYKNTNRNSGSWRKLGKPGKIIYYKRMMITTPKMKPPARKVQQEKESE